MRSRLSARWRLIGACLSLVVLLPPLAGAQARQHRRALLIGCTRYPYLEVHDGSGRLIKDHNLTGPANDVELVTTLLREAPYALAPSDITALVGWPAEAARRPAKANIISALERLAQSAQRGDQIVIMLAGHGSQQPARPGSTAPDGLDEIFLAADVKGWNGATGAVENALANYELGERLERMRSRGAFVWVIVDACHSGGMIRLRGGGRVERYVVPEDLGIPVEALRQARQRASELGTHSRGLDEPPRVVQPGVRELVAFYAAHPGETTPEMSLSENGPVHGLFTYTLAEVMRASRTRLTYRELAEAVDERYRAGSHFTPRPMVEGGALDREVLGVLDRPLEATILVKEAVEGRPGAYRLAGGDLDGLTKGSILAVLAPGSRAPAEQPVAHLRIDSVTPTESDATVVEAAGGSGWNDVVSDRIPHLAPESACKVLYRDYGTLRMPVAIQTEADPSSGGAVITTHPSGKGPAQLEAALTAAAKRADTLVSHVDDAAAAKAFVRARDGQVFLVPASGIERVPSDPPEGMVRGADAFRLGALGDPELPKRIDAALRRVARAVHLMSLVSPHAGRGGSDDVQVQVEMLQLENASDRQGTLIPFGAGGRVVRPGDWVGFRVTNRSRSSIDVTLLYLSSTYEIRSLFPRHVGDSNELGPGRTTGVVYPARVNADSLGAEQAVAIAVEHVGPVSRDFSSLAQPELERAKGPRGAESPGSALEQLLDAAMYGVGGGRGLGQPAGAKHDIQMVGWITLPRAPAS